MQELTREQLYEMVWAEPINRLAKKFDLSDRGLGKLCARHEIPVPGRDIAPKGSGGTTSLPCPRRGNPDPQRERFHLGEVKSSAGGFTRALRASEASTRRRGYLRGAAPTISRMHREIMTDALHINLSVFYLTRRLRRRRNNSAAAPFRAEIPGRATRPKFPVPEIGPPRWEESGVVPRVSRP